ncbi:MAG: hypothetical protein K1X64_04855 [Myxococcaceae bacterium]|nr:hypothetical protein [Myxococcaceae bacterium]
MQRACLMAMMVGYTQVALAAEPLAATAPTLAEAPPRFAVWVTPLVPPSAFASGVHPLDVAISGTVGFDFSAGWQAFQLELSAHYAPGWGDADITELVGKAGMGGSLALGVKLSPFKAHSHLEGFFIAPKVMLGYATAVYGLTRDTVESRAASFNQQNQSILDVQAGANIGYQWVAFKHLYLATVVGVNAGASLAPVPVGEGFKNFAGPFMRTLG